ncbi:MAG: helix-turn-helix domain-containing protein [Candidatus Cybelea sp.]
MIAMPSGAALRLTLRTGLVVTIAVAALGLNLQILVFPGPSAPGNPDFTTGAVGRVQNVVRVTNKRAYAAGISPGDRIEYSLMPVDDRYGIAAEGLRLPPIGKAVSYIVEHHGKRHIVTLAASRANWDFGRFWVLNYAVVLLFVLNFSALFVVLILLGSALAVIRPTELTAAFFLFVAQFGALMPAAYYFLPPTAYAAVEVVWDMLAGLGAIGFLGLALYLDPKRRIRSRQIIGAGAILLAVIVAPVAISDVSELMVGIRPEWPLMGWASFLSLCFCYVTGIVLLLRVTASASAPRNLQLLAALLAFVGVMTIFSWTMIQANSWYLANLPSADMNRTVPVDRWTTPHWLAYLHLYSYPLVVIMRILGALLGFYLIVRWKIVDTGPVLSRMVLYVIVVLFVVAGFAVANTFVAQVFHGYALLVPIEILAALAIGFWASGLRDFAGCLSLASVDAWSVWAKGRPRDERDALTHALRLAERMRQQGVVAEVRAQMMFRSWRDGDDDEFERDREALVRVLGARNMRGLRGFALAATSDDDELHFRDADLSEWRARAALIRCGRTDDAARAQQYAADALTNADRAGLPSLQILALVAIAETHSDQRDDALERAHAIAIDAGWPALSKSILSLRANARDIGILQRFVEVRLRKTRPGRPMFEVSFFNGELCQNGTRIPLPAKELELLFAVASARAGVNDTDLIDELWPEADGDAARNAFRVCLHRLRKKSGDGRIVMRAGKGYVLHPWADVDLWRFQSLVATCAAGSRGECAAELRELCDALRAGEWRRATLGEWFYRFEQILARNLREAERLLDRGVVRSARATTLSS